MDLRQHKNHKYIFIHRLVAKTFIPNPNNLPIINHKDNNPLNNCIDNLEWCTQSHNVKYAYKYGNAKPTNGCFKKGSIPYNRKKINQYDLNGNFIKTYISLKEAAIANSISRGNICSCLSNTRKTAGGFIWKYVN